jgi:hypothetical protein
LHVRDKVTRAIILDAWEFVKHTPYERREIFQGVEERKTMMDCPKGKYKIYLVSTELVTSDGGGNSTYTPSINSRYDSADTTGIELEVDGKTRRFDFTVERPARR